MNFFAAKNNPEAVLTAEKLQDIIGKVAKLQSAASQLGKNRPDAVYNAEAVFDTLEHELIAIQDEHEHNNTSSFSIGA